ncbi:MAG: hypothetical protein J6L99_06320 [Ruminococcus sp.]|nr:hypothetical protein [Ruminococcus sp.]
MALFKKKNNQQNEEPEASKETNSASDVKEVLLAKLNEKLNGTLYDGCIIMPRGFTIDVKVGRQDEHEGIKIMQVIFIITHDDFDEALIEPVDAQGKTTEEACEMAVSMFMGGVWHPLEQSMQKKNGIQLSVNYLGQHYDFDMYAQSIVRVGVTDKQPTMLLAFIKNEIPKYIGSKKYYWVRIYLAKFKEKEVIEVRVNGSVCGELNKYFKEYVDGWDASEHVISEKQYAIFVQREDDQCPFKKEKVVEAAKMSLERMPKIENSEQYTAYAADLDKLTEDKNLAAEIRIFIPEILAKLTLGYQEGDSLFLLKDDQRIELKKSQLRSYFYLQQVLIEYLAQKPPVEDVQRIVFNSVAFRELKKAQEQGHEVKDLYVAGTQYSVNSPDYKVW